MSILEYEMWMTEYYHLSLQLIMGITSQDRKKDLSDRDCTNFARYFLFYANRL